MFSHILQTFLHCVSYSSRRVPTITTIQSQASCGACPERALGVERIGLILTTEDHEEAIPVVLIHPPIQERVGKSRTHSYDMEHCVYQFVLLKPEHQVQIAGQLEDMEWQPAGSKHHHYQRQHLGGLFAAVDAVVTAGRADVILQFDPDADVSVTDDG